MTTPNYSLTTVVTDTFTAPRYVHYLVKIATGIGVLFVFWLIPHVLLVPAVLSAVRVALVASIFSVLWFLSARVLYFLDHRRDNWLMLDVQSASAAPLLSTIDPRALVKPDLGCDLALHCAAIAGLSYLVGLKLAAFFLLIVLGVLFELTYPRSSP